MRLHPGHRDQPCRAPRASNARSDASSVHGCVVAVTSTLHPLQVRAPQPGGAVHTSTDGLTFVANQPVRTTSCGPRKRLHVCWPQYTRFWVPNSAPFSSKRLSRGSPR